MNVSNSWSKQKYGNVKEMTLTLKILNRSRHPEKFLGKGILKICSKFTKAHPCWSAKSIKLQSNFIEITLRHGSSPVNLLHTFRTFFLENTSGWLLLSQKSSRTHISLWDILKMIECKYVHFFRHIFQKKVPFCLWIGKSQFFVKWK